MKFSNRYIFLYITILVVIIACGLALVSLCLHSRQENNRLAEKSVQILKAAGYSVSLDEAVAFFNQVATKGDDFETRETYAIRCADGEQGKVVYVNGQGLWGPIWGYVVLASDGNTIKGVTFAHKSETPGLGAKIVEEDFSKSFIGKKLYDDNGEFVAVTLRPKGRPLTTDEEHTVDAISGATITSIGVQNMLYNSLKEVK
ncbi:MAG: FMN-binding protein [Bacteroidales bacterium]|nr:FMN-binding protein [Bacteroidales bacterium]